MDIQIREPTQYYLGQWLLKLGEHQDPQEGSYSRLLHQTQGVSDSLGLCWVEIICIPNKSSGDTCASGLGTTL